MARALRAEVIAPVARDLRSMPVMNVGIVRMGVNEGVVSMPMAVRLVRPRNWGVFAFVVMLMMLIMHVQMFVFQGLVHMFMLMPFRNVKPYAERHQCGAQQERRGYRLPPYD